MQFQLVNLDIGSAILRKWAFLGVSDNSLPVKYTEVN